MNRIFLITFLYAVCPLINSAQKACDDSELKQLKNEIKKTKCTQRGLAEYDLAVCLKNNNDTRYRIMMREAYSHLLECYDHPSQTEKTRGFFACAHMAFELGDFKSSEMHFLKGFASLHPDSRVQPHYLLYFAQVLYQLKRPGEAMEYLEAYQLLVKEDKDADTLLIRLKSDTRQQ